MGDVRSETTCAPFQNPKFPYPPLSPAIPPVSRCMGVPHPCSSPLPHSPPHTPPLPFSSHSSPFPPSSPPPGSLCPSDSCLEPSVRWAAHQLGSAPPLIWVKSCSRNVEGNGGWGGRAAGEQASLAGLCIPVVSAWPPELPATHSGILAVCLRQESESTYS